MSWTLRPRIPRISRSPPRLPTTPRTRRTWSSRFKKPYSFEGETYTEVDLSGLEDLSAADLCKVGKMVKKIDGGGPHRRDVPALRHLHGGPGHRQAPGIFPAAARPGGHQAEKPCDGFSLRRGWGGITPPEIRKACVALAMQLHSGIDYFLEMSLEDLNELAKVVMEYAQKQNHGTGHQNRR